MRKAGLLPYGLVLAADFYLLPLCMRNTGSAMLLLLCVMPLTAFAVGVLCGVRRGFCPLLPAAAVLLFLPTIFLYYNPSAWAYGLVFGGIVLAGNGIGRIFYGKR
ncbi:MAG: hypothetical protein HFG00_11765 [Oscillibacter sp.]|nr:hypothetical protein [Oscillibacter sp.]